MHLHETPLSSLKKLLVLVIMLHILHFNWLRKKTSLAYAKCKQPGS